MNEDTFMALLTTLLRHCRACLSSFERRVLQMLAERIRRKGVQIEAVCRAHSRQSTGAGSWLFRL
jgi:hypothetical protein